MKKNTNEFVMIMTCISIYSCPIQIILSMAWTGLVNSNSNKKQSVNKIHRVFDKTVKKNILHKIDE